MAARARGRGIGSVDNALQLLLLYRHHDSLGVSQAAALLGVSRSTAHRLMTTLARHDFVVQDLATRLYRPGPSLRQLGATVADSLDVRARCRPHLRALCEELAETVHLVVLREADALFLESIESRRPLRVGSREGEVVPAYASSAGKALLATLPRDRLHELYPEPGLRAVNRRTLRTRAALERELESVRRRGYAVNVGEAEPGITAAGAALAGLPGGERVGVSVSAPDSRIRDHDDVRVLGQAAARCAERMARDLGTLLA
jgi:IclR family transcriptional regulator, acetate operon repressor